MSAFSKIFHSLTSSFTGSKRHAQPLAIGARLPHISSINQDQRVIHLHEFGAQGYLLVYFYPKADTPGCTKQACSLRDAFDSLTQMDLRIFGVSIDTANDQKAFQQKYQIPFDLLADKDAAVTRAFGVPQVLGFSKRQAFLFKDGHLIWRDLSASTAQQAADITRALQSL